MKQRITAAQLNELPSQAKDRLSAWWHEKYGRLLDPNYVHGCQWLKPLEGGLVELHYLPYLTIGEMIEYLMATDCYRSGDDQHWLDIGGLDHVIEDRDHAGISETLGIGWTGEELCDRLWDCVKPALEAS